MTGAGPRPSRHKRCRVPRALWARRSGRLGRPAVSRVVEHCSNVCMIGWSSAHSSGEVLNPFSFFFGDLDMRSRLLRVLAIAALVSYVFAGTAFAATISVNVNGTASPVGSQTAGVVPVGNWNDIAASMVSGVALKDSTGDTVSGLTLSTSNVLGYDAGGNADFGVGHAGDTAMMKGLAYTQISPTHFDMIFTGTVPYDTFDVYVYYHSGQVPDNVQTFSILDSSGNSLGLSKDGYEYSGAAFQAVTSTQYAECDGTSGSNGNYVKFSGLTSSEVPTNFIIRTSQINSHYAYINGVQIVGVPEPSTIILLVSGVFGLLAYAWRKRK